MKLTKSNIKSIAKKTADAVVLNAASVAATAVSIAAVDTVIDGVNVYHYNKAVSGLSARKIKKMTVNPVIGTPTKFAASSIVGGIAYVGMYTTLKSKIDVIDKINDIDLEDLGLNEEDQEELRKAFGEEK
jgi:hypothetical protein